MIRNILILLFMFTMLTFSKVGIAVCTGGNYAGNLNATISENWSTVSVNSYTYYTFTPSYIGQTFIFSFCQGGGSNSIDTQLVIHDSGGSTVVVYNDDHCGFGSEITFIAPSTGVYRISIYQYYCNTSSVYAGIFAYRTLPPPTQQDCLGALPLCDNVNTHAFAALGEGNYYDLHDFRLMDEFGVPQGSDWPDAYNNCPNCMLDGELNSMWYTFSAQTEGLLMFTITHPSNEIYDWSLHSLNGGTTCFDLVDYVNHPPVSCNWYGCVGTGTQTGMQAFGGGNCQHWPDHCTGNAFNAPIWVDAGDVYALHISSYIGGPGGYTIDFSNSTAQIVDDVPPFMESILYPPVCGSSSITIQFSERIWCGGVDPSSFILTGPQGTYDISDVWAAVCEAGSASSTATGTFYDDVWTIELSDFLSHDGEYTLTNINSTVVDICDIENSANTLTFNIVGITADVTPSPSGPCHDDDNGSITVTNVTGGTPPYSYSWTGPAGFNSSAQNISNLEPGDYYITITDNIGVCEYIEVVNIASPPPLTYNTNIVQPGCGTLGSVQIIPNGGVSPYNIQLGASIQNGVMSYNFTNLAGGTHNIVITDAAGCQITGSVDLLIADNPNPSFTYNGNQCFDGHSFNFTHTGVVIPGETYQWTFTSGTPASSVAQNPSGITFPGPGTYNVQLEITAGICVQSFNQNVTVYAHPTPTVNTTDENCGTCDGEATTSMAYSSYNWSSGGNTQTEIGLCTGNYSVIVTDANGCSGSANFTISNSGVIPTINNIFTTDPTCAGDCDGTASVDAVGPASINYAYSSGSTPNNVTTGGLCDGSYNLTVSDATNPACFVVSNFSITEPPGMTLNMSATNSTCGLTNGQACVSVVGGNLPLSYLWAGGQTADCITVAAGNYTVTVTDIVGCTVENSITVSDDGIPFSVNVTVNNNISCNGECDGSAIAAGVGAGPFTYSWSTGENTPTANLLCVGNNFVTVTEAGCDVIEIVSITEPPILSASITGITDANCGLPDGSITVTENGGTSPYLYQWSTTPVQNTPTATNLPTGNYTVTVEDDNGCTTTATGFIDDLVGITNVSVVGTNISCNGLTDGSATATVTGGTANYTYNWSNGFNEIIPGNTSTANGLGTGVISVIVTDSNGCTGTHSATISEPLPISIIVNNTTETTCNGDCDGTVDITASGGTAPYSYVWSSGFNPNNNSNWNLCAGNHSVIVTDANGCTESANYTIDEPNPILLDIVVSHENCGLADGSATVNPIGGTAPYSYTWSHGGNPFGQTNTGLTAAGSPYGVTVTDDNACFQTGSATINFIAGPIASISTYEDVGCNGDDDGWATVSVGGGTPPYTYQWNTTPAQANPTAINLSPGNYTVTVADQIGCSTTANITISQPGGLNVNIIAPPLLCFGDCDGTAFANTSGGTMPYSAIWSNLQTGLTATNLCAGSYQVTVTDDNGCSIVANTTFDEQPQIVINETITPSNCNQSDGSIEVSVSGGAPPYSYNWSNGAITQNIFNIPAGPYNLTVTDNKGCEHIVSYSISDMNGPVATISASQNTLCFGSCEGTATVSVALGTGLFQYAWNTVPVQTTATATSLCAGNYNVVVTDLNTGCISTTGVTITEPSQVDILASLTDASCFGVCDGEITLTPFNGTPPYSFVWSGPGVDINAQNQTGLCAGSYTVNILDSNNCYISRDFDITSPDFITVPVASTSTGCFGGCTGTASAAPIGGTPPYFFLWEGGQTTATAIALCSGPITVTVTDYNGCTAENTANVNTPTPMQFTDITINDVQCSGSINGSVSLTITGGTPPYDYAWDNGSVISNPINLAAGQHCVTVFDNNGCEIDTCIMIISPPALSLNLNATDQTCNGACDGSITANASGGVGTYSYLWSNSEVVPTINNLCNGVYNITVTDDNGCQAYASTSISEPAPLGIVVQNIIQPTCGNSDGAISIGVTGGTPSYTYEWSSGTSSGNTLSNIPAGNYTITVTDSHGCSIFETINLDDISAPVVDDIVISHVDCFGNGNGTAEVFFTSTTTTNSINWSNGDITALTVGLTPGTYSVTVTDDNGCIATDNILITEPPMLTSAIAGYSNVTCNGFCNGEGTVIANGGTPPYSYSWSNGNTTSIALDLCPGIHEVTVFDANGCQSISNLTIDEPLALTLSGSVTDVSCYAGSDGVVAVTAGGGTGNYFYSWPQIPSNSNVITGLTASSYTVILYDNADASCFISETFIVDEPNEIEAFFSSSNANCGFDNGGACVDLVTGGTGSFTYNWNPGGATTQCINNVSSGTYSITITDANGCNVEYSVDIDQTPALQIDNVIYQGVSCFGYNDGYAEVFASGGTQPYVYNWTPNVTDQSSSNTLYAGIYNVQVVDQDGCAAYTSFPISTPEPVILYPNEGTTICIGQSAVVAANASGGTNPYTYTWQGLGNGQTFMVSPVTTTEYIVVATDSRGCQSDPDAVIIDVRPPLSLVVTTPTAVCQGQVASLVAEASGGDESYVYDWGNNIVTTSNVLQISPHETTTYTVIVHDGCGTPADTATVTVSIAPMPEVHIQRNPYTGCAPLSVVFDNNTNQLNYTYYWDFDDPDSGSSNWSDLKRPTHTFHSNGLFDVKLIVTTNLGCKDSATVQVRIHDGPTADFIAHPWSTGLFDPEIEFTDMSDYAVAWEWDFGDGTGSSSQNPTNVYFREGEFPVTLIVYSQHACVDSITKEVSIIDDLRIYFPTAINLRSPGNHEFYPKGVGIDVENYQMTIYNRWGEEIYTTTNYDARWQGRYSNNKGDFVPQGVYTYLVTLRDKYGRDYTFSGFFTVFK
jgi:hypothetical protein